jgi:trk system potassium uptake protein TrkA
MILGCGRVGAAVAQRLSATNEVTVIDWNSAAFERLGADFGGNTIVGNGIDVDVLRAAGAGDVDLFLALTNGDNRNLMASQIAKGLGARKVVTRVYDPVRCEIYAGIGLGTMSPTVKGARRLFEMVTGEGAPG